MTKVRKNPIPFSILKTIFAITKNPFKIIHGGIQYNDELVFQKAIGFA